MALYDNWVYAVGPPATITIVADDVRGATEGNPFSFQDIIACDAAKGWGADVAVQCTVQYCLGVRLIIGDGVNTTWFVDTEVQVTFKDGVLTAHYQRWMDFLQHAYGRFGILEDAPDKTTSRGCCFNVLENSWVSYIAYISNVLNTQAYFYSCHFTSDRDSLLLGVNLRLYNSLCADNVPVIDDVSSDMFNSVITSVVSAISYPRGTCDRLTITECTNALYIRFVGTIWNLHVRQCTNLWRDSAFNGVNLFLINTDSDVWTGVWTGGTGIIYRQYEFDCVVRDKLTGAAIVGATVSMWNNVGGLLFSVLTGAGGAIATQIVTHGTFANATGNVEQLQGPFHLRIEAPGYKDYDDIAGVPLDYKTTLEIGLNRHVDIIFVDGKPVLNLSERDPDNELYRQIG